MDQLKRYLWPIATGGAVLVIALIAVSAYIIPEGHKVSTANASKITLRGSTDNSAGADHRARARVEQRTQELLDASPGPDPRAFDSDS